MVFGGVWRQVEFTFARRKLHHVGQLVAPPGLGESFQMYHQIFGEPLDREGLGALPSSFAPGTRRLINSVHDFLLNEHVHAVLQLAA